jgi:heme exporter protein A
VTAALTLRGVSKYYGDACALHDVDLTVEEGVFLSLLGPNGAGKTTLLALAATVTRASEGNISVFGLDPGADGSEVRALLGLVSHESFAYGHLTALENLEFYAHLYGLRDGRERSLDLLDTLGLYPRRDDLVRTFSRGLQQRLAIARALLHNPRLLLLDEPFSGLDAHAAGTFSSLLSSCCREGRTVIMATHRLEEGLLLADTIALLDSGCVVFEGGAADLSHDSLEELYLARVGAGSHPAHLSDTRGRP